jgi:hypothetical protein
VDHGVVRSALAAHHRLKVEREAREAKTKARQKAFLLGPRDPGAVTALATPNSSPAIACSARKRAA